MKKLSKDEKIIEIVNVSKVFSETVAVDNVSLYVRKGEFITFLGPSGCGKTTTLRMIAGFDLPSSGKILLNGKDITDLPPTSGPSIPYSSDTRSFLIIIFTTISRSG